MSDSSSALVIGFPENERKDLLEALDRFGYCTVSTDSVQQAIEAKRTKTFQIAFLAGKGSAEDFHAARQLANHNGPGVLLCTDEALRHDVLWARAQGVVGFVLKPFDFMRIGQALATARG